MPPAGDVFGLDGIFLTKSNPVVVSTIGINSTDVGAGITVVSGVLNTTVGIATLTLSTAAGLSTTPFYVGAKIAVSGLSSSTGIAYTGYNGTFVVTGFAGTTTVSYATTGYVGPVTAGITTTGLVILVSDTQVTNTIWSSAQTHGWFGGGFSTLSIVDRIDFSNDTGIANIRSPLSSTRYEMAATGNSNYGWFGGGYAPPGATAQTKIERIDFSNDLAATSIRGSLTITRVDPGATANSNYGWFGGGRLPSVPAFTTSVDRIDFSNDSSTASPRGPLNTPSGKSRLAATGNSNYGWFGGGTGPISTVDRIDFSNDSSTASPRGPLSSAKTVLSATGNSNYGWFGGGGISTVDRIDFSNDFVSASVRGSLSSGKSGMSATGNSNYGWFGGGYSPTTLSIVDRIDFSNDNATASVRGPLTFTPSGRRLGSATSGQARSSSVRLQKAGNYGWFGGGINQVPFPIVWVSRVDRIDFSNDSITASPRGVLSSSLAESAATGNSNYGWFGGGSTPTSVSRVDRIDFSNDSSTASPRGSLSLARQNLAATGNSNYGWFGGGFIPSSTRLSRVDRINFANDSATASVRGPLSLERFHLAATGNSNYGWFGGGYNPALGGYPNNIISTVDRIDFSNDSSTASPRGPLSSSRYGLAATGNSNYGWFGGYSASSRIDRIDFSNDSTTASPRGVLSSTRRYVAATGNSNYGWWGGGNPAPYSTVDRINFSNDTGTASPRGVLGLARPYIAATSNTPIG